MSKFLACFNAFTDVSCEAGEQTRRTLLRHRKRQFQRNFTSITVQAVGFQVLASFGLRATEGELSQRAGAGASQAGRKQHVERAAFELVSTKAENVFGGWIDRQDRVRIVDGDDRV